jgi:hypothetical protein
MADGGFQWEIPTSIIPEDLRFIGSRFELVDDPAFDQSLPFSPTFRHMRVNRISGR